MCVWEGGRSQTESQIFPVCSSRLPPKSAPIIFYGPPTNTLKRVSVSLVWGWECKSGITMHVTSWEADFFVEDDKSTWHCRGNPHVQTARGINWIVISHVGIAVKLVYTFRLCLRHAAYYVFFNDVWSFKTRISLFWLKPEIPTRATDQSLVHPKREDLVRLRRVWCVAESGEREQAAPSLASSSFPSTHPTIILERSEKQNYIIYFISIKHLGWVR